LTTEDVSDWRELATLLPADQAAALARTHAKLIAAGVDAGEAAALMLESARQAVAGYTAGALYADVLTPPGATVIDDWEPNTDGGWSRGLHWGAWGGERISVDVNGRQEHDGSYTQHVTVYGLEDAAQLDAVTARRLAAHLLAAADLIDD
jgi:hypothetical protein